MNKNKEKNNNYEVLFITKREEKEKVKELTKEIDQIDNLKSFNIEIWKEMKPAYKVEDIDKNDYALYFLAKFSCEKKVLKMVDNIFKLSSLVKRYKTLNISRDSKKMKIGRIQNPKPRVKRRPASFSRENTTNYKNKNQHDNILSNS